MLLVYFLTDPVFWLIPWVLQAIGYIFVLRKMELRRWPGVVPFLAERELSRKLFSRMRTFYRPFVVAAVLFVFSWYLDPTVGLGKMYMYVAFVVYGIFLVRLYWRLARAFGKGKLFAVLLILIPAIFLAVLGLGKARYEGIPLKPLPERSRLSNIVRRVALVLISALEITVLVGGVGFLTIQKLPPSIMVYWIQNDTYNDIKNIQGDGKVLSREDMMGEAAATAYTKPSREKFFPDHSRDKNVVVLSYFVGSDLENSRGLASANIRQMKDSTEKGDALTYVMEAGGARRWFTPEIDYASYGRYEIAGGEIKKVQELPDDTCMSEPKTLADFLKWAKKEYPADRYMLVLWDHGGGVGFGYGNEDLNRRKNQYGESSMTTSEVVSAIRSSGIKFDLVGFDACLMQDIEIAAAMEPCADYYLASEEEEGGFGWFYTSPFGKLAEHPGMSTEELTVDILSSYDQLNTIIKDEDGKPDTRATLSLVDTTLAAPAYDKFSKFMKSASKAVEKSPKAYASLAVAGSNAYTFAQSIQMDLIDFMEILQKTDYEGWLGSEEELEDLTNSLKSCVLYRNRNSAKGINGLAFAFPYKSIALYGNTSSELAALSLKSEKQLMDRIFSIIAVEQKKGTAEDTGDLMSTLVNSADYSEEDWYVKGFENYDTTKALVDIPLQENSDGYQVRLPEKTWSIITDCQTMVYQKTGNKDRLRYLGKDYIGAEDADGHPLIGMDDQWIHVDGQLACFKAEPHRETKNGTVFSGKIPARLNDEEDINLIVEWDPVKDEQGPAGIGRVIGYEYAEKDALFSFLSSKGNMNLEAGDTLQLMFDIYDGEGKLIKTAPDGEKIRVTRQSRLEVKDAPLEDSDIVFGGVLTDIYQRTMTTEQIEMHVGH